MNPELLDDMVRLCPPGDRDQNDELYPLVVAGDPEAREQMITNNMSLVISKVEMLLMGRPEYEYLRDDLTSAGFLGLVQAVNKMAEHDPEQEGSNPTGYLSIAIQREMNHLADEDNTIVIPHRTQSKARRAGRPLEKPQCVSTTEYEECEDEAALLVEHGSVLIDLRDLLDSCCRSDDDRTILRMREEGNTYKEIGDAINLSGDTVEMLFKELYQRFLAKWGQE